MTELLMFHPDTLAQQFIPPDRNSIDKLKALGWIENPRLVNMYHDGMKKYVMVPVQNQKEWENKGYFAEPTMIYHPTDGTRMVSSQDAKSALNKGWYASPAHFSGNSEGKIKQLVSKEAA